MFENVQAAFLAHHGRGRNFWSRSEASTATRPRRCSPRSASPTRRSTIAGTLSYGNQKQLELGIALASDPQILLLDEPTAGMSATETHETIRLLERIAAERELTLLFTEHDMEVVFSIAQKIAVLHQGRHHRRRHARPRCATTPRCGASISGRAAHDARCSTSRTSTPPMA